MSELLYLLVLTVLLLILKRSLCAYYIGIYLAKRSRKRKTETYRNKYSVPKITLGLPFKVTKPAMILSLLLFSISCSSNIEKKDSEKDVSNLLVEMEGIISVLAVDEIDPLTGRRTGKFVNYLQVDTGERYILEPYDKVYHVPLQPNTKVRVFGFKKDKMILYKKIVHINKE